MLLLDPFENVTKSPTSSRDFEEGIPAACGCSQDVSLSREVACNGLHKPWNGIAHYFPFYLHFLLIMTIHKEARLDTYVIIPIFMFSYVVRIKWIKFLTNQIKSLKTTGIWTNSLPQKHIWPIFSISNTILIKNFPKSVHNLSLLRIWSVCSWHKWVLLLYDFDLMVIPVPLGWADLSTEAARAP